MVFQQVPIFILGHGSKLLQVADKQQLHTAKRFRTIFVAAEYVADRIQQVGTYHTDFVYHQQVQAPDNIYFIPAEFVGVVIRLVPGCTD